VEFTPIVGMLRRVGARRVVAVDAAAAVADPTGVSEGDGVAEMALELTSAVTVAAVRCEQPDMVSIPARATAATRIPSRRAARRTLWSLCSPCIVVRLAWSSADRVNGPIRLVEPVSRPAVAAMLLLVSRLIQPMLLSPVPTGPRGTAVI
jgi:hypothetical protein